MQRFLIIGIFLLTNTLSFAQIKDSSINIWQVEINYSFQVPGGDLAKKYGINSTIGAGLTFKTHSNFMFGGEISYLFGSNIKRDTVILDALRTSNRQIINEYGEYATVMLTETGFYAGVKAGKLWPIGKPNKNSGIVFELGGGLLQHHIRIENKDNNVPSVLDDYKKGYDRLCNGFAAKTFLGYQHLDNKSYFNFYAGIEFYQAWTKSRRDFNFDTMSRDNVLYHDYLYSVRLGWILPLYYRSPDEFYYY